MYRSILAAVSLTAACLSYAQVEVVDRSPSSRGTTQAPPSQPTQQTTTGNQQVAELYYQLQVLQQEVLELRGLVETQTHELKRLKQQRLDDYLDLDRRLSQLGSGASSSVASPAAASVPSASENAGTASPADELKSYRAAIDLVLKQQNYDAAVVKLKEHLQNYPKGRYAGNALYWLGEIYLLKGELETSRQWFSQLLSEFPDHPKVADAQFKLGKVHHLMGDDAQAKTLLERAARAKGNAGRLARDYLQENFDS